MTTLVFRSTGHAGMMLLRLLGNPPHVNSINSETVALRLNGEFLVLVD